VTDKQIKKQSITMSTIIGKAVEAVVAYIALWFFKPVWERIVKWWKGKDESNS
tara:strand:+ start:745 stop:903 length:159 start_codon:yes stop_codon:yes gene_type:complete